MAKPKLKIKKSKNLPKFTIGGEESNIYVNQVGNDKPFISSVSSSDPFGTQKDLQGSSLTKSQQPLMFAGQAPKSSGLNIDAGRFFNNTASDSQASASAGTSGASQSNKINNVAGYAQMAGGAARAISAGSNKRDPNDFRSKQIAQEDAVMNTVGQIGPVGGAIAGLYNVGQSIGDPIRQSAEAMDKQAAEKGQAKLANKDQAASMAVVGGIFDPIKALQARSSYEGGWTDITGQGYAKHLEKVEQQRLDEMNKPKREAELADTKNKLQYGTFTARKGGVYPTNAIPMHGNEGAWAIPLFSNGGQTFQVDGPSHEQGGIVIPTPNGDHYEVEKKEVIKREPDADKILSDKLIDKRTGKTYAKNQAPYEKLKEQVAKFKNKDASKNADDLASVKFDENYNNQEMDKTLKSKLQLERDFFKCGGMVKYKNGGIHINPANRGKFTAAAKRAGMGVQEYANHILAHKDNYSSTLVKRANFAHNAAGWKHEDGGYHPYGPTGYTLTNKVKLNNDPTQLPQGFNYTAYNQFQKYIAGKDFINDPRLNTNEGKKLYTDQLINEFNQSDYIKKFPQNKITPDYITAVQKYHKLSDPNVVVDGWVGSQTSQMRFPVPEVNEKMTDPNKEYYNATWGNKKYKLPANKFSIDPTNKKGTYSPKDLILVEQRYGGVQKFTKGGEKTDLPTVEEEDPKLYTLEEAANNAFWRNQYPQYFNTPTNNVNPNNPYASTFNFNMPVGGPLDQAILRDRNQSYASDGIPANAGPASSPNVPSNVTQNQQETSPANKAEGQPGNYNQSGNRFNGDALYSGLGVLANSAGPLAYMIGEGKNYDRQQFYKYSPSELDFTPTKRAYDARRRAVLNNVKNLSGGHSGAALSNIAAQNADLNQSEDTAMREFANQMASIRNQAQQFNIQGQYSVDDINARNKGQALTNYYKSIGALGTNTASGMRDYRMASQEQEMLPMMKSAFSDPAFLAMYQEYLKKHGK